MQTGISFAVGQLLAVVAPRTVLVVDAPTDWSLAGPLWELALDDAPVDEILDVLIRRGIRTAPSFAIVRVEDDAVRALVRGSVPVCFERTGEPVRLDATGATSWLEGLISGAKRVLVGQVDASTPMPYLVSTGVVLVAGLALPCGADTGLDEPAPGLEDLDDQHGDQPGPGEDQSPRFPGDYVPAPSPMPAGASAQPARIVDLTRGGARPAQRPFAPDESRESWPVAGQRVDSAYPAALNGHAPAVLAEAAPQVNGHYGPITDRQGTDSDGDTEYDDTGYDDAGYGNTGYDDGSYPDEGHPDASYAGASSTGAGSTGAGYADPRYAEPGFAGARYQDTGYDQASGYEDAGYEQDTDDDRDAPSAQDQERLREYEASDLLVDAEPVGPSPADLPNFDPPSLSLPMPPAGRFQPPQPPRFEPAAPDSPSTGLGAPAGWPPMAPGERVNGSAPGAWPAPAWQTGYPSPAADDSAGAAGPARSPGATGSDQDDDQGGLLPELPFRVRGQSLPSEQREPQRTAAEPNGFNPAGSPLIPSPEGIPSPSRPVMPGVPTASGASAPAAPTATPPQPMSGSLLLPAFFRGARAARSKAPASPPVRESGQAGAGAQAREGGQPRPVQPAQPAPGQPSPYGPGADGPVFRPQMPSNWTPPVRRLGPDRTPAGPPAGPGGMWPRPGGPAGLGRGGQADDSASAFLPPAFPAPAFPAPGQDPAQELDDAPAPSDAVAAPEGPREPPRLLGVWCDAGHVTSPDREECRVCGLPVPPQAPILVARPPLGVLVFDNGDRVDVDRPVVLGRDPKPVSSPDPETPVLHAVSSATGQVSRTHAEVRASGWDVVVTDLEAMNGTALTTPGASPVAIEPGVPTVLTSGSRIDLGGESGFVFEIEA